MTEVEKIILENQVKIMKILDEIVNTVAPNRWAHYETDARDNIKKLVISYRMTH